MNYPDERIVQTEDLDFKVLLVSYRREMTDGNTKLVYEANKSVGYGKSAEEAFDDALGSAAKTLGGE